MGADGTWSIHLLTPLPLGAHTIYLKSISGTTTTAAASTYSFRNMLYVLPKVMLQSTSHVVDDTAVLAAAGTKDQPSAQQAEHHTVVDATQTFKGTAGGNETVDLNADATSYFKQSTAHIEGAAVID